MQARRVIGEAGEHRTRLKRRVGRRKSLPPGEHVGTPTGVERGQPIGTVLVLEDASQSVAVHVGGRPDGPLDRERDLLAASSLHELVSRVGVGRVG